MLLALSSGSTTNNTLMMLILCVKCCITDSNDDMEATSTTFKLDKWRIVWKLGRDLHYMNDLSMNIWLECTACLLVPRRELGNFTGPFHWPQRATRRRNRRQWGQKWQDLHASAATCSPLGTHRQCSFVRRTWGPRRAAGRAGRTSAPPSTGRRSGQRCWRQPG